MIFQSGCLLYNLLFLLYIYIFMPKKKKTLLRLNLSLSFCLYAFSQPICSFHKLSQFKVTCHLVSLGAELKHVGDSKKRNSLLSGYHYLIVITRCLWGLFSAILCGIRNLPWRNIKKKYKRPHLQKKGKYIKHGLNNVSLLLSIMVSAHWKLTTCKTL